MLKQFIVLPVYPKMSCGKLVSQGSHATTMALASQKRRAGPEELKGIEEWMQNGQCVIVCEVPSQSELIGLKIYCDEWKIPAHLYVDEGFTEIPCGTCTAFATGVLTEEQQVRFSKLKLWDRRR